MRLFYCLLISYIQLYIIIASRWHIVNIRYMFKVNIMRICIIFYEYINCKMYYEKLRLLINDYKSYIRRGFSDHPSI